MTEYNTVAYDVEASSQAADQKLPELVNAMPMEVSLDGNNTGGASRKKNWTDIFIIENQRDVSQTNVPKLTYFEIFKIFLSFGCRAFGGPVTQIAMMKQELIDEQKWITKEKFTRVYAVYQVLPGPEAAELCCYFGYLAGGRLGAIVGGLGFILPGALLMLLWSYLYTEYGTDNGPTQHAFRCIQNTIAATLFRSTYKLAEHSIMDHVPDSNAVVLNWYKCLLCVFAFLLTVLQLNFFLTLAICGIMNTLFSSSNKNVRYLGFLAGAATIGFYILYYALNGLPSSNLIGGSLGGNSGRSYQSLFVLGLIAGLVSFGGAYTTFPFIFNQAVTIGGWLTSSQFLDAVAIVTVSPTPTVSFVALVGWIGNGFGGSVLMLIGIFIPAISFTVIGHEYFEAAVDYPLVHPFLDGISSGVIGLLVETALNFLKSAVSTSIDAVVFAVAFWALFHFTNKFTQPMIIIIAAIAGQVLYG